MKLTPNFDTSEFDIHEPFPVHLSGNRQKLAIIAQWLRDIAGSYGRITSAYRSPARNAEVGGTETSQHQKGEAIDIVFPLASMRAMAERVLSDIASGRAPHFGQIIFYVDRGHIHLSLPTLGNRNGEVRFSFTHGGDRLYPFLTAQTIAQLPGLTGAQASVASKASGGVALLALLGIGVTLLSSCAVAQAQVPGEVARGLTNVLANVAYASIVAVPVFMWRMDRRMSRIEQTLNDDDSGVVKQVKRTRADIHAFRNILVGHRFRIARCEETLELPPLGLSGDDLNPTVQP